MEPKEASRTFVAWQAHPLLPEPSRSMRDDLLAVMLGAAEVSCALPGKMQAGPGPWVKSGSPGLCRKQQPLLDPVSSSTPRNQSLSLHLMFDHFMFDQCK